MIDSPYYMPYISYDAVFGEFVASLQVLQCNFFFALWKVLGLEQCKLVKGLQGVWD